MVKLTKNNKEALSKVDIEKLYDLNEASSLIKKISFAKFDASVDIDIRLGVDPKQANQMVRGIVALPHGTGKELNVLVLCEEEDVEAAKAAGADHAGLDDYLEKIKNGWLEMDVIITTPKVMPKLGRYGKVLGPRGLMPNPKAGTVTTDIAKAVKEVKSGKIDFKVDKYGIIHSPVGRVSFEPQQLAENINEFINVVQKLRPTSAKGTYMKGVTISSTMSPGIRLDVRSVEGL